MKIKCEKKENHFLDILNRSIHHNPPGRWIFQPKFNVSRHEPALNIPHKLNNNNNQSKGYSPLGFNTTLNEKNNSSIREKPQTFHFFSFFFYASWKREYERRKRYLSNDKSQMLNIDLYGRCLIREAISKIEDHTSSRTDHFDVYTLVPLSIHAPSSVDGCLFSPIHQDLPPFLASTKKTVLNYPK